MNTMSSATLTIDITVNTSPSADVKALRAENKWLAELKKDTRGWLKETPKSDPRRI